MSSQVVSDRQGLSAPIRAPAISTHGISAVSTPRVPRFALEPSVEHNGSLEAGYTICRRADGLLWTNMHYDVGKVHVRSTFPLLRSSRSAFRLDCAKPGPVKWRQSRPLSSRLRRCAELQRIARSFRYIRGLRACILQFDSNSLWAAAALNVIAALYFIS